MSMFKRLLQSSGSMKPHFRGLSNVPDPTVYGGPKPQTSNQKVTLTSLRQKYKKGEPIIFGTAYDYPSAVHLDNAGIDMCLVGDSAAIVVHGHDTTLPISLDEMLVHCRTVARGAKRLLLIGDLPFGTYESSTKKILESISYHGLPSRITAVKAIVEAGIAVMGHAGLTPQTISVLGGFRPQGKTVSGAIRVVEAALALQEAGCFTVSLECVPAPVAAAVTSALKVPTIGIGAGPFCSGQVLIYHDLIGTMQHPHQAKALFSSYIGCSISARASMMFRRLFRSHISTKPHFLTLARGLSNVPKAAVYGGPKSQNLNQRVTLASLRQKQKKGEPITMMTAHDYPSAVHVDTVGIDMCLVGDSAAMVVHGHDTTLPISLEEMLVHCRAVARGAKRPLLVRDLPFGTYESNTMETC